MKNINPLFLIDFYKATHAEQYPDGMTKLVSYYTPRMARLPITNKLVHFGLQGFIKEYLIDTFNEEFFNKDIYDIESIYQRFFDSTLGTKTVSYNKINKLYRLGYLPIEIKSLPEGSQVPVGVPMFEITNTLPEYAWLVNTLETMLSCSLWHTQMSATIGYAYRKIVNKAWEISVDDNIPVNRALGDFSMRGQESIESAMKSSAAFLLSFLNTATVPAILYLSKYYNCDYVTEPVGYGMVSFEHSTVNSSFAVDGDEETLIKRALTKIYPNRNFSFVSDSYDFRNLVENILPRCKKEIMEHQGFISIRGDSGDPVEVTVWTVEKLWDIFGGTINFKGFKVLDSHIKVTYGDSITLTRVEEIYRQLIEKGFACNNVSLGVGSFSMQCLEVGDNLYPFTRDTFGIAIKSTYCEVDGKKIAIYKSPKESSFKASHKGICRVGKNFNDEFYCEDGYLGFEALGGSENLLETVFRDGKIIKEQSLQEIRQLLHGGKF